MHSKAHRGSPGRGCADGRKMEVRDRTDQRAIGSRPTSPLDSAAELNTKGRRRRGHASSSWERAAYDLNLVALPALERHWHGAAMGGERHLETIPKIPVL